MSQKYIPSWESSERPRINSDLDFPFEFAWDLPGANFMLESTYKLPNINYFTSPSIIIDGGIIDISYLPKHSIDIDIDNAEIVYNDKCIYLECEYISISDCVIESFDIKEMFPNAKIVLSNVKWV
jgi:hypothetical protein